MKAIFNYYEMKLPEKHRILLIENRNEIYKWIEEIENIAPQMHITLFWGLVTYQNETYEITLSCYVDNRALQQLVDRTIKEIYNPIKLPFPPELDKDSLYKNFTL